MPAPITWATPSQAPASTLTTQGWCGSTTANCRVRAVVAVLPAVPPAAPRGRADLDAAGRDPRPGELPDLPLEFPLGAEEVRVAIPATVPDAGPKTPNFRASGIMLPPPPTGTASPASRGARAAGWPGRPLTRQGPGKVKELRPVNHLRLTPQGPPEAYAR